MREGDLVACTVERFTSDGDGVAKVDARELVVPGAFPGESVKVRVLHLAKKRPLAHGRLFEVVTASEGRRAAPCAQHPSHGGRCTGCALLA
ncbi:MAG: TRAM domain-containing protein, partial [Polyangiaceae bacterium]|nr:TRAM domain-containing protein [Polyangiaceae bacterium]